MKRICRIFIFTFALTTIACTPQKRLSRLVARHPELLAADTVRVTHTVVLPAREATMTVPLKRLPVTANASPVVLTDAATGIAVTIARKHKPQAPMQAPPDTLTDTLTTTDTLTISVSVPADTTTVSTTIPVARVTLVQKKQPPRWCWYLAVAVTLLLLAAWLKH